jgi:Reverse transcriptase (RNA-dependent DNA polymerase)
VQGKGRQPREIEAQLTINLRKLIMIVVFLWKDTLVVVSLFSYFYVDYMSVVGSDLKKIKALKERFRSEFATKDLGAATQILGMRNTKDRKDRKLWLSHEKYIENVFQRFNMDKYKLVTFHLVSHFKLSHDSCFKDDKKKEDVRNMSYASAVGSLMYAMVYRRLLQAEVMVLKWKYRRPGHQGQVSYSLEIAGRPMA